MAGRAPRPFSQIPGPSPAPGGWRENAHGFVADPLPYMNALCSQYGPLAALVQGGNGAIMFPGSDCPGTVFAFGPALNRHILTSTQLFHSGPIIGPIFGAWRTDPRAEVLRRVGTGLFSLNGEEHQRQRRLIQPAFHRREIDLYAHEMIRLTHELLADWPTVHTMDFQRLMFSHTLRVAGRTLFGRDFAGDAERLASTIQRWLELIPIVSIDADPAQVEAFLALSASLDADIRAIIREQRASEQPAQHVLASLIHVHDADGDALTDDELIGHINILLTAGHETTANVLSWTIFLLAQHPDVQRQLQHELDEVLAGSEPSTEAFSRLPTLENVIRESMRLLPPVTMGSRVTAAPAELAGYELPPGTEVVFSHYHTHHDPSLYPQPKDFLPDRWQHLQPDPYTYLPFSAGTKMCIGAPFALMEIRIVLAMLLQRFHFAVPEDAVIERHVWVPLRPDHMPIIAARRDLHMPLRAVAVRGGVCDMVRFPSLKHTAHV